MSNQILHREEIIIFNVILCAWKLEQNQNFAQNCLHFHEIVYWKYCEKDSLLFIKKEDGGIR